MAGAQLTHLNLGGAWRVTQQGRPLSVAATVPGNIHLDLRKAGKIPDPFFRDNETALTWIHESTWVYEKSFDVPANLLQQDAVRLRCEGLDTVATITLNGKPVGAVDNMFRTWEFDVKPLLRAGKNRITITFTPVEPYLKAFGERAPKIPNAWAPGDFPNLRKAPYSNGWDFGPKFLTSGIYKKIELLAFRTARIGGVLINQDLRDAARAHLDVAVDAESVGTPALEAEAGLFFEGKLIGRAAGKIANGTAKLAFDIPNPQLWWPINQGAQPLYEVTTRIKDAAGTILDVTTRRIGLRRIELLKPTADKPLRLAVNGREIFTRGANWIPLDVFPAAVTAKKLRAYVADAAASNMNILRLWGGGYYEEDALYDACDEKGILLWMDLKFACAAYPGMNPEFRDNIIAELRDQIPRWRHHPSIAVVCGNNEVHGLITGYKLISQEHYDHLFHEVIGREVAKLFPQSNYVGGSPEAGDEHDWWVWHIGADFEQYLGAHGFFTEFGFQSFPEPATVDDYTEPGDRDSVLSAINKFHQRNGNKKGNEQILDQMKRYFRPAKDFDSTLWLSQINQAYGMDLGIRNWRTDWPKTAGAIVWQFNDCWPGPSWSSVDYFGRWKAAQYAYRAAFAPLVIDGVVKLDQTGGHDQADNLRTAERGGVQVRIASEFSTVTPAKVGWKLTDLRGREVAGGDANVSLPAGTAATTGPLLKVDAHLKNPGAANLLLWLNVTAGNEKSSDVVFLARPKFLDLVDPKIGVVVAARGDGFDITVTAAHPALWTWLTCADPDARYSDNFFHLPAGGTAKIHVVPTRRLSIDEFKNSLKVRSLLDTYEPGPPRAAL